MTKKQCICCGEMREIEEYTKEKDLVCIICKSPQESTPRYPLHNGEGSKPSADISEVIDAEKDKDK